MLYTVTIVDDRNNQKLRGQDWVEVSGLFQCHDHGHDIDMECAACVLYCEVLDALAETGSYSASGVEYSPYYGEDVNWHTSVIKED